MPTTLSPQDFMKLAEAETNELLCSMYFPLDSTGIDLSTKKLQLKNATQRLRSALLAKNWDEEQSSKLLGAMEALEGHEHFLDPSTHGLAILVPAARPEAMQIIALAFRPDESLTLGERYSMTPLLRLFGSSEPRTVLAVAEGGLRLLKGTAHHLKAVPLPETFPKNRDEVTRFEAATGMDRDHNLQQRLGGGERKAGGGGVEGGMASHGQGPKESVEIEYSRRFFKAVGEAMQGMLSERETILLAGVHEQLAAFRRANPDLPLLEAEMTGNFEAVPNDDFVSQALCMLQHVEQEENRRSVSETQELGTDWWTTHLEEAEEAARMGRVHMLFVNESSLNLSHLEGLVLEVIRHAGTVRTVQREHLDTPCLARFRWSNDPGSKSPLI